MDPALGVPSPGGAMIAGERGTALIVDSDSDARRTLNSMLVDQGFDVLESASGEEALKLFERRRPDLVFMEIALPGMDGLAATRSLKRLSGTLFVPVLFLTDLRDEASLVRCTEAGGDDFLSKPINPRLLRARIIAMERVQALHRTLAAKRQTLSELLERDREEQALAERVLSRAVKSRNVAMDRIALVQRPATIFNGDLVLAQHLPDGGMRVLVGDFTGHGLAAAVGALPVADTFHAMTLKGVSDTRLLSEINRKLYRMLPADRFMAACLISIPGNGAELRFWNGGMPSAWLRRRLVLKELTAHALPLGILPELPAQEAPRRIRLCDGDRLLLMSDGLLEACDEHGDMFVNAGFEPILQAWEWGRPVLPTLLEAMDRHCRNVEQADDIAVIEIPLDLNLLARPEPARSTCPRIGWSWSLNLEDERLCSQPSVESALRPLGLLRGLERHLPVLETVFAELFTNALEHGVLGLDSAMKSSVEGFDAYYRERARRLSEHVKGHVFIEICFEPDQEDGGRMCIRVSDSGEGFDEQVLERVGLDPTCAWGYGIRLLRELCESVSFRGNGSDVEVVYRL